MVQKKKKKEVEMKWGQSNCTSEFLKCYVAFRTLGCGGRKSSGKFSSQRMRRVWKEGKKKEKKAKRKTGGELQSNKREDSEVL